MITCISTYLYPDYGDTPFVCIHRSGGIRFHDLTKASSKRLARAARKLKGTFRVDGQGWCWYRQE